MHEGKGRGTGGAPRSRSREDAADDEAAGLMRVALPYAPLNLLLELYLREIVGRLGRDVRSVVLYGSAALGDLAPAHGDVDLLVALRREAGGFARRELAATHEYLARTAFDPWGAMLEARYVPWAALGPSPAAPVSPAQLPEGRPADRPAGLLARGRGVTSLASPCLTTLDMYLIHEGGALLHGESLSDVVPLVHKGELLSAVIDGVRAAEQQGESDDAGPYLKIYLGLSRLLAIVACSRPVSKSEAARWFAGEMKGKVGDLVMEASRIRTGELKVGPDALRRGKGLFLDAVRGEVDRLARSS